MRRVFVAAVLLGVMSPGARAEPEELPARIESDTTLDGAYRMSHDVVVAAGATLRLAAGTTIEIAHGDSAQGGEAASLCELDVHGALVAEGTADKPVRFLGTPAPKKADDKHDLWRRGWLGIVLRNDRPAKPVSVLRHVVLTHALGGVQVSKGSARIDRSIFFECDVAVGASHTYVGSSRRAQVASGADPRVSESLFVRCNTGVFVEGNTQPEVVRSVFTGCRLGVGSWRTGRNFKAALLGARVERCAFIDNDRAVQGDSRVHDSLFLRNKVALAVTSFHARYAAGIDRMAWRHNVFHGNEKLTNGECDIGSANVLADPVLEGLPADWTLDTLRTPLAGLRLAEGSPAIGTATDGGDPGPAGKRGPGGGRGWVPKSAPATSFLALGPLSHAQGDLPASRLARPKLGARVGKAWWSTLAVNDAHFIEALPLGLSRTQELIVAVAFRVKGGASKARTGIEVNADGNVEATLDGTALRLRPAAVADVPMRSGSRGLIARLRLKAAKHLLILRWRPRGVAPRLGVAVHAPEGGRVEYLASKPSNDSVAAGASHAPRGQIAVRPGAAFHWADLARRGVFVFRAADGEEVDLVDCGLTVADQKPTLRATLPSGVERAGGVLTIKGLRTPGGAALDGQPASVRYE